MRISHSILAILLLVSVCIANTESVDPGHEPSDAASGIRENQYPPGVVFSTILNSFAVNADGGWIKLGNQMQNVFMPDGATGRLVLSTAEGKEICHWAWQLDGTRLRPPFKLFGFTQPVNPDGSNFDYSNLKITRPGKYVLDFFIGAEKFYTFPFGMHAIEPDNPFDGKTKYLVDGAWNDWGYLFYTDANAEQNLIWKIWLRESEYKQKEHKLRIEVVRDADKKLICQNRENMTFRFRSDWVRHDFDMINPPVKTSGGAYFKAKDLLAVDGGYTLTMKMDGAVYGVWKFKVEGGKLNYSGRTVRGSADPMTFIEGATDAWWYEKVK